MRSGPFIVLLRPSLDVEYEYSKPVECLGLGYLCAALRQDGHRVSILDAMLFGLSEEQTIENIIEADPTIVGITVVVQNFPPAVARIAVALRAKGYKGLILLGGHSVSFIASRILDEHREIDGVVRGEGETPFRGIANAVADGRDWQSVEGVASRSAGTMRENPVIRNRHLDKLSRPARDMVPSLLEHDGLIAISTSRGCYARCTFCSVPRFFGLEQSRPLANGNWIARPADDVVDEMASLHREYGLLELLVVDDEFFGGTSDGLQRAREIGRLLATLKLPLRFAISCRAENVDEESFRILKNGGLAHVFVGVESGLDSELKLFAKGQRVLQTLNAIEVISRLGLSFQAGFMMFNHRSTPRALCDNLLFLRKIGEAKPYNIDTAVEPYFGTPLGVLMSREGAVTDDRELSRSTYLDPSVAKLRLAAQLLGDAARPFVGAIAAMRSSVTYQWRRAIPGRTAGTERLLDAYETTVNNSFFDAFWLMANAINEGGDPNTLIGEFTHKLNQLTEHLHVLRALVATELSRSEGQLRHWRQLDLINWRGERDSIV